MAESTPEIPADSSTQSSAKKISTADFEFGEVLGEGAYGAVRQALLGQSAIVHSELTSWNIIIC